MAHRNLNAEEEERLVSIQAYVNDRVAEYCNETNVTIDLCRTHFDPALNTQLYPILINTRQTHPLRRGLLEERVEELKREISQRLTSQITSGLSDSVDNTTICNLSQTYYYDTVNETLTLDFEASFMIELSVS